MAITFSYADRHLTLSSKRQLKSFIEQLFALEGKALQSLTYVFCSDDYLLDINRRFLQHDYYTDIITFDLSDSGSAEIVGEIYLSIDRVKENAVAHHTSFKQEVLRVIFHGALHLCGYGDKKKSEIAIMRHKEDEYLRLYGTFINDNIK